MSLEKVSILAELERNGITFDYVSESSVKVLCPFHSDHSPSCHVDLKRHNYKCFAAGCMSTGDFATYLAGVLKTDRTTVLVDLAKRYGTTPASKIINANVIESYHAKIWQAFPLLKELYDRGITDDDIRELRLGEHHGRITIPITDEYGLFVNIRKYLPGAPGSDKMQGTKGHNEIRLWPMKQLAYPTIVILGGELKQRVVQKELNAANIGAVTTTAGEGNWDKKFSPLFHGKKVYVCLDIDDEGQSAAHSLCDTLRHFASWVGNVVLPLNPNKYPHGDVNDLIGQEKQLFLPLLDVVEKWTPPPLVHSGQMFDDKASPNKLGLHQASHARWANKRLQVKAIVAAMDTSPFAIPKSVTVLCDKQQPWCNLCPVKDAEDRLEYSIHNEHPALLEMINTTKGAQSDALKRGIGVPLPCLSATFNVLEYYNIEDVRLSPELEVSNRASERTMTPAMCIGNDIQLNENYQFTGRMHPHPKTQHATLLISKYRPTKDALSTYQCNKLERLGLFQPLEWTVDSIQQRLDVIYEDFEANITRIYMRRDVHLIVDLAYHSPLLLNFDGKQVKGWVEALVVGDSAQGKTETVMNMLGHYALGEKVECKNASVAGLLGGLAQMGTQWFVSWGIIPTHDKRLVVLEELKGASKEVIAKLTDMRSSGIAEIPKIEKRKTHARTRLIALSNSRSGHAMASYNYGIEAIAELIGALEDVRRFDISCIVSANDLDVGVINQLQIHRPKIAHLHTSELCRQLILWAWTRTTEQISFDEDATALIMAESTNLCEEFTDAIPVIDRGSTRHKIARLSASLASRTFSTGESLESIRVRGAHVQYTTGLLRRLYSSSAFGYGDYTESVRMNQKLVDPTEIKMRLNVVSFPRDFVKQSLHSGTIDRTDIADWLGWDREKANELLSFLVRKHALVRDDSGRAYRKTPPYIQLLKHMLENGTPNTAIDKPKHIPIEETM
jgi:hypothetical protein